MSLINFNKNSVYKPARVSRFVPLGLPYPKSVHRPARVSRFVTLGLPYPKSVHRPLRLWNRCDISWTEHLTPDYPANLYLSVGIGFGQIIEEKKLGGHPISAPQKMSLKKCPHRDCLWPPFESVPPIKILMFAKNPSSISFGRFTAILS